MCRCQTHFLDFAFSPQSLNTHVTVTPCSYFLTVHSLYAFWPLARWHIFFDLFVPIDSSLLLLTLTATGLLFFLVLFFSLHIFFSLSLSPLFSFLSTHISPHSPAEHSSYKTLLVPTFFLPTYTLHITASLSHSVESGCPTISGEVLLPSPPLPSTSHSPLPTHLPDTANSTFLITVSLYHCVSPPWHFPLFMTGGTNLVIYGRARWTCLPPGTWLMDAWDSAKFSPLRLVVSGTPYRELWMNVHWEC